MMVLGLSFEQPLVFVAKNLGTLIFCKSKSLEVDGTFVHSFTTSIIHGWVRVYTKVILEIKDNFEKFYTIGSIANIIFTASNDCSRVDKIFGFGSMCQKCLSKFIQTDWTFVHRTERGFV